jgi:ribosomal protein S18 acetylase RimI-like enzyme
VVAARWHIIVDMKIRRATPEDVPAVLPLVQRICAMHQALDRAKYDFRSDPGEMYRRWLGDRAVDRRSVFLVVPGPSAATEQLVAFLVATVEREIPIYRLSEYGFIHDLWVEPDYRHEGLGRQLVMLAIERFAAIGVKQIRLDTAAANDAARNLFSACGFRISTMEMFMELPS